MSLYVINDVRKLTTALYGQHKIYCGCSVNYIHDRPVVRFQLYRLYVCALRDVRTYNIYIYLKNIYNYIYIYIYDEDFSPLYDTVGAQIYAINLFMRNAIFQFFAKITFAN